MNALTATPRYAVHHGCALDAYGGWETPTVIISDGPYGVAGYDGDPRIPDSLPAFYAPHAAQWAARATPSTTLWFWCTEIGWALSHPALAASGWVYKGLNIWDKGLNHIAGNCNGKTMRRFPVVTEVCAHYVRKPVVTLSGVASSSDALTQQDWLRAEWRRAGLTMANADAACGVRNAASRKYLAKDSSWYPPPAAMFDRLVEYANRHGGVEGRPYFTLDRSTMVPSQAWEQMRGVFNFEYGTTNVWACPALRGRERLKSVKGVAHPNQKPLALMDRIILAASNPGDVVWEPFGGTMSGAVSAIRNGRRAYTAEVNPALQELGAARLAAMACETRIACILSENFTHSG